MPILDHQLFQKNSGLKNRRGVALLVVLGCIVFMTTLLVAFLFQGKMDLKSSKMYADGSTVKLLAQSTVNIVMGEIREATRGQDPSGADLCWASQPGMIRTYTAKGNPDRYFKLYSSESMIGKGAFGESNASQDISKTWSDDRAIFTDLNQPVSVNGRDYYPIISGNNLKNVSGKTTYDHDGDKQPDIEGFYLQNAPTASGIQSNPIPMPSRWLYVLANGKVVAPRGTGDKATIEGAGQSPIVGRIAFWTDDETCKVNVNTASEGSYWDTPKFSTAQDLALAKYQPAQHEYQRYPGHPATTSLSSALKKPGSMTEAEWKEEIYKFVPRVVGAIGSSYGGTQEGSAALTPDTDRLYPTVDEFIFKAGVTGGNRKQNDSSITKETIEQSKFFLTANSRSPDLNLFNKPRVCIWPISSFDDSKYRTVFDRLIAFCSTVGENIFYFQRSDPNSATADLPSTGSKTGLGRNRQLIDYLKSMASKDIPGFGGKFSDKYSASNGSGGTDCDQILTQTFDYIRSTNLQDSTAPVKFQVTARGYQNQTPDYGQAQVVPILDQKTSTRGFGRFATVHSAFLMFIGKDTNATSGAIPAGQIQIQAAFCVNLYNPALGYPIYNPNLFLRVDGLQNFQWEGVNGAGATLPASSMGFPAAPATGENVKTISWFLRSVGLMGGVIDFSKLLANQAWAPNDLYKPLSGNINQQLQTTPISRTFQFTGGDVTIQILAPDKQTVLQTVTLNFPSATLPVPELAPLPFGGRSFRRFTNGSSRFLGDLNVPMMTAEDVIRSVVPATGDMRLIMARPNILSTDSAYSNLFAPHINYSTSTQPQAHNFRFELNKPYYGATAGRLLNLDYYSAPKSQAVYTAPTLNMSANVYPLDSAVVPTNNTDILGDWDNGVAYTQDGPYINKPDEGAYKNTSWPSYFGDHNLKTPPSSLFSPNRMMPSAGMFGSLPTGVWANQPWQTLLFCPNPLKGSTHRGFGTPVSGPPYSLPPDYLFLDFFHMPVVEPYAISEPLSTAGKINMNYQIVPFTYINRDTGIRAVLKSEKLIAVNDSSSATYKNHYSVNGSSGPTSTTQFRFDIDAEKTIEGFSERFKRNDLFRSASEICSIYLVPKGETYSAMASYWSDKRLTGDNSRERPYTTIYPRLTTKSNTFTVHMRVQTLQKTKNTAQDEWVEGVDVITGEYRGSQTIERYIDPSDPELTSYDFADSKTTKPLGDLYKFRVTTSKHFSP